MGTSTNGARTLHAVLDRPTMGLWISGVIREGSNVIIPAADCHELYVGDRLIGRYLAADQSSRRARLQIRANPRPSVGSARVETSDEDPRPASGTWELHTTNMRPCGYTLTLQLVDQADDEPQCLYR